MRAASNDDARLGHDKDGVPKVGIGIPVYNGETWLAETVESILRQSFTDFRVMISDNASTDRTAAIAARFAESDSRIRYHRNETNVGVFRNFDLTLEMCGSRYFKWCAVGDRIDPSFLEQAVCALDSQPEVSLVYSRTRLIGSLAHVPDIQEVDLALDSDDVVSRYKEYLTRARLNSPFHGLIRTEALLKTGLNKPFWGSDECLVAALLLQGKFVRLADELLFRRVERSTSTVAKSREELEEFYSVELNEMHSFASWKFEKQLLVDILRTRLNYRHKASILAYLMRRLFWKREILIKELMSFCLPRKRPH